MTVSLGEALSVFQTGGRMNELKIFAQMIEFKEKPQQKNCHQKSLARLMKAMPSRLMEAMNMYRLGIDL